MNSITVHYTEKAGTAGIKIRVPIDIANRLGLRDGQSITQAMRDKILAMKQGK